MIDRNADLIHLNCGLHDLKFERATKAYQQPLVEGANLCTHAKKCLLGFGPLCPATDTHFD
jgi:hypothetical protein